ncbi:MAG: peptidylprolyl isomerase [Treponema sp.]
MKKSVYTIGSLIILLIAAAVFVLVPIFAAGRGNKRIPPFGKYAGTEIRYEQGSAFADAVANMVNEYQRYGSDLSGDMYAMIFESAFGSTVTRLAAEKAVAKSGYHVPKAAVNRSMRQYFLDENGEYSQKVYRRADPDRVRELRKNREEELIFARYMQDLFGNTESTERYIEGLFGSAETIGSTRPYGLKTSKNEIAFIQEMNEKRRAFHSAAFNMNDYPDEEKSAYGRENAAKFVKYDLSVITCDDKAKASALLKRLSNSEITFADAVGEYSQQAYSDETGKLRSNYGYQIEKMLSDPAELSKITELAADSTSEAVQTSIGFSIFHADGDAVQPDFENEDTIKAVYNYLTSYEFGKIEDYYTQKAKDFADAVKANGFDAACAQFGLTNNEIPAFPINYGNLSVLTRLDTGVQGLYTASTDEKFLKTAFSLKIGDVSEPLVMGRNVVVIQYAAAQSSDDEPIPAEALTDELENYDSRSAQSALMASPKLENNVREVFDKHMRNN